MSSPATKCEPSSCSAAVSIPTPPRPSRKAQGFTLYALTILYGQRHAREIEAARAVAAALGVERHLELDVDLRAHRRIVADLGRAGAARSRPGRVPTFPSTYVPARNTIFLSLALGWAEVLGAHDIVIGVNALDYSGYPDCRPEFIAAFEPLARWRRAPASRARGSGSTRRSSTLTKADIIRRGLALGLTTRRAPS